MATSIGLLMLAGVGPAWGQGVIVEGAAPTPPPTWVGRPRRSSTASPARLQNELAASSRRSTATTTTTAEPSSGCSLEVGYDFQGNDLLGAAIVQSGSAVECGQLCSAAEHCSAFSFLTESAACYLKTSDTGRVLRPGVVSGVCDAATAAVVLPGCSVEVGYDYTGNDLPGGSEIQSFSALHCAELCKAGTLCNAFTYIYGKCFLKANGAGRVEHPLGIAGNCSKLSPPDTQLVAPAPPAPPAPSAPADADAGADAEADADASPHSAMPTRSPPPLLVAPEPAPTPALADTEASPQSAVPTRSPPLLPPSPAPTRTLPSSPPSSHLTANTPLCLDLPAGWKDVDADDCDKYVQSLWCTVSGGFGVNWSQGDTFGQYATAGIGANDACCGCGGGFRATMASTHAETTVGPTVSTAASERTADPTTVSPPLTSLLQTANPTRASTASPTDETTFDPLVQPTPLPTTQPTTLSPTAEQTPLLTITELGAAPTTSRPVLPASGTATRVPATPGACTNADTGGQEDTFNDGCSVYIPEWCGVYDDADFNSTSLCCVCGGEGGLGHRPQRILRFRFRFRCRHTADPGRRGRVEMLAQLPPHRVMRALQICRW